MAARVKMTKLKSLATGILLLTSTSSAFAEVHVLDFDSNTDIDGNVYPIVAGQVIDTEYAAMGVTISSCNYARNEDRLNVIDNCRKGNGWQQTQITYDTVGNSKIDTDLEFKLENGVYESKDFERANGVGDVYNTNGLPDSFNSRTNPGNILILSEYENKRKNTDPAPDGIFDNRIYEADKINDQGSRAAGYFTFDFDFAVNLESIDFFDIEDEDGQNPAFYAIQFYGENGDELTDLTTSVPTLKNGEWTRVQYDIMGVYSIRINLPGSGGIDNLAFSKTDPNPPSEVSTPASIMLLSLSAAFILRRRRK